MLGADNVVDFGFPFRTSFGESAEQVFLHPSMLCVHLFASERMPVLVCIEVCPFCKWIRLELAHRAPSITPKTVLEYAIARDFWIELRTQSTVILEHI